MTIYLDMTFMGDGIKQLDAKLCLNCMHYFITYEPHFPYGCRALSFKSKRLPCNEVFEASNSNCLMFIRKLALQ